MRRGLQLALGLGLSVLFVWLSLRGAPLDEVFRAITSADLRFIALASAGFMVVHFVRIWRWSLLLRPVADVRFRDVNALGAVGFMALMLLPMRLGEFARPLLVARRLKVRRSAAFASVVVERIVDGLFMGLLLVGLLWGFGSRLSGQDVERVRIGSLFVTAAFGAGLVALVLGFFHRDKAEALIHRLFDRLAPRLAVRLASMMGGFVDGLHVVPDVRSFAKFLGMTTLYWGLNATIICLLAPAFGFTLTPLEGATVLGLQVIGAMIPAGPGMVGTIQFFTILGVGLFVGDRPEARVAAVAFAHTAWALSFSQQVLTGLYFVATGRVPIAALLGGLGDTTDGEQIAPTGDLDTGGSGR